MKIKTAELTGAALNWAVAMCGGWKWTTARDHTGNYPWLVKVGKDINPKDYRPSTNWMQGGPIIERERIAVWFSKGDWKSQLRDTSAKMHGTTPLIAAMRCYVASKMGDEAEIPEEVTL